MVRSQHAAGARAAPQRQRQEGQEGPVGKGKATDGNRWPSCGLVGSRQPFSTELGIVRSGSPNRASCFSNSMAGVGVSVKMCDVADAEHAASAVAGPGPRPSMSVNMANTVVGRDHMAVRLTLPTLQLGCAGLSRSSTRELGAAGRCCRPRRGPRSSPASPHVANGARVAAG